MRAELFHADGQADMKVIVAFRNFANAPKMDISLSVGGSNVRNGGHLREMYNLESRLLFG